MKLLFIFGTRPEAIKLAPIIKLAQLNSYFDVKVLVTAQHRQMLDQVLKIFDIKPDYDLDLMKENQDLTDITVRILEGCRKIFTTYRPDLAIVHGDTTTTMAASLAAFYQKIEVAHVEAGLRTYDMNSPYPEELNRVLTSRIAKYHFPPTEESSLNLLKEGIRKEQILVTGNTVIDSLFTVLEKIEKEPALKFEVTSQIKKVIPTFGTRKFVLITGHRRENFGTGLANICEGIVELAIQFPEIDFIYPVHLNPNVQSTVNRMLSNKINIKLIEPFDYIPFAFLMSQSYFIITDSGGIQEEAPSLKKPVLVTRTTTERPEALAAGVVKLVGTDKDKIVSEAVKLLTCPDVYQKMVTDINPYGDGKASEKILKFIEKL